MTEANPHYRPRFRSTETLMTNALVCAKSFKGRDGVVEVFFWLNRRALFRSQARCEPGFISAAIAPALPEKSPLPTASISGLPPGQRCRGYDPALRASCDL